ncbi:sulfotransferase family 2 domain-containing protein [Hyphococcus luteus]|uniref:Sulfotransferase n=1 Tax=Hyphococcus luteus TaxID=2058213 RepID=A0A2S7K7R5_9PROT|nr:sulfotransferase family 2 domain-containing protein [Marinicaulis flavus]PQA88554.1 hypothetical protein CW354_09740 [Marinicaulis flavus]
MQPTIFAIPNSDLVFIAMPKAGNSSILAALSVFLTEEDLRKADATEKDSVQKKFLPNVIRNYDKSELITPRTFTFTIVRNPWDRVVSHYSDKVASKTMHKRLQKFPAFRHKMPFEEYVAALDSNWDEIRDVHVMPQTKLCFSPRGRFMPDFIMRLERIEEDFELLKALVKQRYDKDIELRHVNRSRRKDYMSYYNAADRRTVAQLYGEDIRFFGYSFDE